MLLTLTDALALGALAAGDFEWLRRAVWAALWLIGTVVAIVGGRVIPLFTASGLHLPAPLAPRRWLEALAHGGLPLLAGLALAGVGLAPDMRLAPLFLLLGIAHALRLARWFRPGVLRVPLLWSLHLAYAWLVAALLGLAAWHLGLPILGSAALHLFTIGTIGGLILAMMARVSLGHTGRALQPPAVMPLAFGAIGLAAAVRAGLAAWRRAWRWPCRRRCGAWGSACSCTATVRCCGGRGWTAGRVERAGWRAFGGACKSGGSGRPVSRPGSAPLARHRSRHAMATPIDIRTKRIYDPPDAADGVRVLVDRLWPRGMRKEAAVLTLWLKDIAPSPALRQWFGHDPARWPEFMRRYRAQLAANADPLARLGELARAGRVTLLYGARDRVHNHALVVADALRDYLEASDDDPAA